MEKLAEHSDMAKEMLKKIDKIVVKPVLTYEECNTDCWFHPNGPCGCVILNDDYLFDMRCDHFMWAEGWHEGYDYEKGYADSILIYCNHKGNLIIKEIMFIEEDD